jgi:transcriptional regulator with PAS, ATPase and Fis domain
VVWVGRELWLAHRDHGNRPDGRPLVGRRVVGWLDLGALALPGEAYVPNEATSLQAGYEEQERQRILDALESTHWNKSRAAEALKMPRRTFYRRLDKYDIG